MSFAEDEHAVGDLGPGGEHEPFRISIRAGTSGADLHGGDAGTDQDRVKGAGELPGAVADQEPEVRGAIAEVHREVADLLGELRTVRIGGDPEDVHVAAADLHDEQAVQTPECHRALHMEEGGTPTRTPAARHTTGGPGAGTPERGRPPCTHRPQAGTAIRWPRATRLGSLLAVGATRPFPTPRMCRQRYHVNLLPRADGTLRSSPSSQRSAVQKQEEINKCRRR